MDWLKLVLNTIDIVLFVYFSAAALYFIVMTIAGFFRYRHPASEIEEMRRIAVLIPAYKEDNIIVNTARKACEQTYPAELFKVFVIADSLQNDTLAALQKTKAGVIEVSFEKRTKAKALSAAVHSIEPGFEVALIIDADNEMENNFLEEINNSFNRGFVAVQGHRVAKNLNNSMAILDAMSEEVNNHLFRKSHQVLGLSAALIGSGMAFDFKIFSEIIADVDSVAEDKEIEFSLLKSGYRIDYLHDVYIFDEKTQRSVDFVNQRSRWLGMQLVSLKKYFFSGFYHLFTRLNIDYFDRAMQMMLPPRILAVGFLSILVFTEAVIRFLIPSTNQIFIIPFGCWLMLWAFSILVIAFSIPRRLYNRKSMAALLSIPKGFMLMVLALFKSKGATKEFVHTRHHVVSQHDEEKNKPD